MTTPVLIYDADCGICNAAVDWVRRALPRQPHIVASRAVRASDYRLTEQDIGERVWMHTATGNRGGHEAVAALFLYQSGWRWRLLGNILMTPPYSWLARAGYALIARNRHHIRIGAQRCERPHPEA